MAFLLWAMVLHFVADFLLQSREMGKKKSSEWKWLGKHLAIQYIVFSIGLTATGYYHQNSFNFVLLNTLIHGVIDWNIWKLYKISAGYRIKKELLKAGGFFDKEKEKAAILEASKTWQYWEDHWFYATIGFDQLLHMSTIVVLWYCFIS